ALMQAGGVAAGVVQNAEDILDKDPQLRHRGHIQKLDHTEMGPVNHYAWPPKLSRTPARMRPAPCLGEHTEYVCTEVLGMSDGEFLELLASGVFG
ncbi:MAG: CoA transferase, partial [Dehalococcoidia bacterium]